MKNYYQTLNKFFDIITPKQTRDYWMYLFLFIVAAILESLGICLIFILLNLMVLEKSTITFSIIDINLVNINQNYKTIILLSVVFLYFIKSVFLSFFYWSQNKFVFDVEVIF